VCNAASRHGQPDLDNRLLEALAVLGGLDRLRVRTDQLRRAGNTDAAEAVKLHREIQARLASQGRQNRIGALSFDDPGQVVGRQRLDVGPVRKIGIRHDRRRIRVGEHDAVALFGQDAAGLRPRVVEFARLADHDRAGPDDQDRLEVVTARHHRPLSSVIRLLNRSNKYLLSWGPGPASGWYWTLKARCPASVIPSLVLSFKLT
jgi:hypothetical protein